MKYLDDPSGMETATFRLAEQCLNQLRHLVLLYYTVLSIIRAQIIRFADSIRARS
jgi:hypothetical protein